MQEDTEMIVRPTREANITLIITMVSLQVAVILVIKLYIFVKKALYLSTTLWTVGWGVWGGGSHSAIVHYRLALCGWFPHLC